MKLSLRLTLAFVLYASTLLAVVAWLAYSSGRESLRSATVSDLQSTAIEKQAALNEWVGEKQMDITSLAASPATVESAEALLKAIPGSPEAQAARDRFVMEVQPRVEGDEFTVVMLLDPSSGQVVAATDPAEEGKFKENRPFFLNGRNAPYVQSVYYSISLQEPAMTASAPLYSGDGKLLGVLAGRLNLEDLNAIINRRAGLWQTDEAFLVNTSNLFVTQPRLSPDPAVLQRGVYSEAVTRCQSQASGALTALDYRDIPALIAYRWLPEHDLCLVVKIDQAEALAPAYEFGRSVSVISAIAVLGTIFLGVLFSRTITSPIRGMQSVLVRFGQGEQEIRLPEVGQDELSDLAREFNRMADSLGEKDTRLNEYASELEHKVEERTAEIKRREERYRSYIDVTGQIGWTTNPKGEVEEDMSSWRKFTGQSEEEVKGWGWTKALHPDDVEHAMQAWNHAVDTRTTYEVEYRICRQDGVYRHFLARGVPIYNDSGDLQEWIGTCIDITERKQAEDALRRFELLSEHSRDIILFMRQDDGRILEANTAAVQAYGYSREELLALRIHDLRAPATRNLTGNQMVQADGGGILFETVHMRKDVSTFPVEVSSQGADIGGVRTLVSIVRDITERKRAEAEVLASRMKLETALASMSDAVFISDNDGRFIEFNDAFATFHKFKSKEECAKTLAEYPEFLEVFMANGELAPLEQWAVPRALRGEIGTNVEYSLRRKDTGDSWVGSYSFAPIRDESGSIVGSVVVGRDITAQKRVEEQIASLSKFPTENPNPVLRVQNNGQLTYANEASRDLLEMWGCDINGTLPAEWVDLIAETVTNNQDKTVDVTCNQVVYSIQIVPVLDGGYVNLYGRDITERKQVEAALRESEAFIKNVLDNLPVGIAVNSVDSEVMFTYMNDNFSKFYRTKREDLADPDAFWNAVYEDPDFREGMRKRVLDDIASGDLERMHWVDVPITRNGEETTFITAKNIPIAGKPLMISTVWDVTDRKRADAELHRTLDELKVSNAELEQFAYVASHDLQEPLRGIAGLAQLLQQRYRSQLDSQADEYIDLIVDSTQRMQTLINDLLAYSRIGRRGKDIQSTDVEAALKAALANLNVAIREYGATITNESLPVVRADATQLIQLFQNLIGNAIKFRANRPPEIHIGVTDAETFWQFSVRDNGIGIEPQYFERIFMVFQRLHTRREYKGTGIGLAICKKIIERHGGRIWVESEPGNGSAFYFTLPKGN